MAIAFQAASSTMAASQTTSASTTLEKTAATNFIVAYGASESGGATAMTYNTVSMTQAILVNSSDSTTTSNIAGVGIYYMFSSDLPADGSYALAGTFTAANTDAVVGGISLSGVAQTAAGHVTASANITPTTSTSLQATIQTAEDGSWLINAGYQSVLNSTADLGLTFGAEQTIRVDLTDLGESSTAGRPNSVLTTQEPDSTASSTTVTLIN